MSNKAFGSGYFGEWIEGENGLPAYNYTCNQITDDKAITQTNPAWAEKRDHKFMIGNDRVVVTCSNYGYAQIRQDEGTPKFLTDYDPKNHQYGGGFGYLAQDDKVISTYYDGKDMKRHYGTGYIKKTIFRYETDIEQIMFAPYGDDPIVINLIKVTNNTNYDKEFSWHEYWAGEMYQLTFTQYAMAQFTFNTANVSRLRRSFARSFAKNYSSLGQSGVIRKLTYVKNGYVLRALNALGQGIFRRTSKRFYDMSKAYAMDYNPPITSLVSLRDNAVTALYDADTFFGSGGVNNPDYLYDIINKPTKKNSMMMLKESFTLKPHESVTLAYAYIYCPEGFEIEALIDKYKKQDLTKLFITTCNKWKTERVSVEIEGMEWLDRELLWHNAYLRGGMTYSSFYKSHILSQGGHYQYLMGLQGAPRDQLQHSLPFIFTEPWIAREHILFTLRELSPQGELPYATTGDGLMVAMVMVPSDLQLMLLAYVAEYVLTTRDIKFLNYKYSEDKGLDTTVMDGVMLAFNYIIKNIGKGPHGLIRIKTGDWNDQAVYGRVPLSQTKTVHRIGESMLNSAIAIYAFDMFGKMLNLFGDCINSELSYEWSRDIKQAVSLGWNGKWFKRAWMGDKVGWLGDDLLWLEPQPWALIGGAANEDKANILIDNIDKLLIQPNPHGAQLISFNEEKEERSAGLDRGVLENGGIWPAVNGYLVWGLSKYNGKLAWEEWLKNSRAYQAEAYPNIWYGIWSGPDSINSVYAKYPGRTQNNKNPITGKREKLFKMTVGVDWEDYPVFNLHAHTWQQYTIFKLLNLEFNSHGLYLKPVIPKSKYSITSRVFSLSLDKGVYKVIYRPLAYSDIEIVFDTGEKIASKLNVNGKEIKINQKDSIVRFRAKGEIIQFELTVADN